MRRQSRARFEKLRRTIAQHAARIMHDQAISDFGLAKRKAAERLGVTELAALPRNAEIEKALAELHRIFAPDSHADVLADLRRRAADAMRMLVEFEPRLVGAVLNGTATSHSSIELHLFSDAPESILEPLHAAGLSYRSAQRRIRTRLDEAGDFPMFRFQLGGALIETIVFPHNGLRQPPLSRVDGRPVRRAKLSELETLLEAAA